MPLPQRWNKTKKKPPPDGFEIIEPVLDALENELRDRVKETNPNKRKIESSWPVHQINWQKTRYVYDMYYTHHRISKDVYQYCISNKLIDAALIAKWKKPGYERLCSTYVINPSNYKFNTVSICRVPHKDRTPEQRNAKDPTTGCMGCASGGKDAGPQNIFGNKYGQNLAAVQIAREKRIAMKEQQQDRLLEQQQQRQQQYRQHQNHKSSYDDEDDDDEDNDEAHDDEGENFATKDDDDNDEDDYGPATGIWAGSTKLINESERIANNHNIDDNSEAHLKVNKYNDDGEQATDDDDDDQKDDQPNKKLRVNADSDDDSDD